MADTKQIPYQFPPVETHGDDPHERIRQLEEQLHTIHQLVSDRLQNHYTAISQLNNKVNSLTVGK